MKKLLTRWMTALFILLILGQGVLAGAGFPKPVGAVNDFAGLIPQSEKQGMEILVREVLQKTGTSVVVVTMQTVEDADVPTYVSELYKSWGIGKKGEDK